MRSIRLFLLVFILLVPNDGFPQSRTGYLNGSILDSHGAAVPGASVTMTGPAGPAVQVTSAGGRFGFAGLSVGDYQLSAHAAGFSDTALPLMIRAGRNSISIHMRPEP
jgi:Carboxypeptidase regulatory-like domain